MAQVSKNEIIIQIALNKRLAEESECDKTARIACKMVTYWEGRLTSLVTGDNAKTWEEIIKDA